MSTLSNVFGTFVHEPPAPPAGEAEQKAAEQAAAMNTGPEDLPDEPVHSQRSALLLVPTMRFDGSAQSPPWNIPEAELWDLLRTAEIELVEERVLDGSGGVFWARILNGKDIVSVFLKFDGPIDSFYRQWSLEYAFEPEKHGSKRAREAAAYEAAKACGMEDLVPPMASREVNPVPLISDAVRENVGRQLRIAPMFVDERLGIAATLQMAPVRFDNFMEHWTTLGVTNGERWLRASDALRHSLYRAFALDYLLGREDRPLCDYLYNQSTDRLAILDLCLSFPVPSVMAQKYIEMRASGWRRKSYAGVTRPARTGPASGLDIVSLFEELSNDHHEEALATFAQVADAVGEGIDSHLAFILAEHEVPPDCVAGFFARLSYLGLAPEEVLDSPSMFSRNVLAPLSRGYGQGEGTTAAVVRYVNDVMQPIAGAEFDFSSIIQSQ